MLDRLPLALLHKGNERDRHIRQHEEREGEHVEHLLARGRVDGIPLDERGEHAEEEHEHNVVEQAEENRRDGACDHDARRHGARRCKHDDDRVEDNRHDGEQHAWCDGHEHVVAGEAGTLGVGEDALRKTRTVVPKHLVKALRPAEALVPGIAEGDRLLVVEHRRRSVGDANALEDAVRGELDVLGEQVPSPAVVLLDNVSGNEKARARHRAARVERKAGLVQELGLAQEPYGIAGGNPVGVIVLGVAVARGRLRAVVEGLVHLAEVVHVEHVVRVEDEIRLVAAVGVLATDDLEAVIERVALANLLGVEALEHSCARLARHVGGVIGAIVGDDEHVDQLCRIVLHLDGVDQITNDRALVAGRNDNGVSMVLFRDELLRLARKHDEHVVQLIGIANGKRDEDAEVEDIHERYLREELVEHQPCPLQLVAARARANFGFAASVRGTSVQTFWIIAALSDLVRLTRGSCSRNAHFRQ